MFYRIVSSTCFNGVETASPRLNLFTSACNSPDNLAISWAAFTAGPLTLTALLQLLMFPVCLPLILHLLQIHPPQRLLLLQQKLIAPLAAAAISCTHCGGPVLLP